MNTNLPNNVLFGRVSGHLANNVLFDRVRRVKGVATTRGWLCTSLANADPMARLCAYLRIALAVALAAAAAQARAVYAVCVGVIKEDWVHSWWKRGVSRPALGMMRSGTKIQNSDGWINSTKIEQK